MNLIPGFPRVSWSSRADSAPLVAVGQVGAVLSSAAAVDPVFGIVSQTLLSSAARTTTTTTSTVTNYNHRGLVLLCNVTVNPGGAQTLQLAVRGYGLIAGATQIGVGTAALGAGGTGVITFSIGQGNVSSWTGGAVNDNAARMIPRIIDCQVIHSGAGSWTYSLDQIWIL